MFAKIKELFANWQERRKFKKFDPSKLEKPSIQIGGSSFTSLCGQTIHTHYKFEKDGTQTPVEFKVGSLSDKKPFSFYRVTV
jgi:hypothetical protein